MSSVIEISASVKRKKTGLPQRELKVTCWLLPQVAIRRSYCISSQPMMIERVDIYFKTTPDGVYELVSLPYSPRTTRAKLAQEFETHLKEKLCFTAYAGFELKKPSKVFIEAFNDGKELPMDELVTLPTVSIIQNHLPTEGCLFANLHYLPPPRPRPPILAVHSRSSQTFNAEDLQLNVVIEHTSSEIPKVVEDFMKGAVQSRAVTQEVHCIQFFVQEAYKLRFLRIIKLFPNWV